MKKTLAGFRAWLIQRMTAIYMLAFIVFILAHFLFNPSRSYADWRSWLASSAHSLAFWLFFAALAMHAWVGVRDVVLDYVRPLPARIVVLGLLAGTLLVLLAWVSRILLLVQA